MAQHNLKETTVYKRIHISEEAHRALAALAARNGRTLKAELDRMITKATKEASK